MRGDTIANPPALSWNEVTGAVRIGEGVVSQPEPQYGEPIEATSDALVRQLEDRPGVCVGAGMSKAAGSPSTEELIDEMRRRADDPIPEGLSFTEVADR